MTSTIYASTRCYLEKGSESATGYRVNMEPEASATVTITGGDTCLRDPNDHTSYLDFHPGKYPLSGSGYVNVTVEFDDLPEMDPYDLFEVHFVGYAKGWYGTFGTGVAWLPPRYYSDYTNEYTQPGTLQFISGLPAFQSNVPYGTPEESAARQATTQDVSYRASPFEQFFDGERFSNPNKSLKLAVYRGGGFSGGFRMYGAYVRITKGVNPSSERLPFVPKFAFALYNSGFVVLSGDGSSVLVNGNNNGMGQEAPQVLFEDGCIAQLASGGLFSVMRPTQDYAYASPTLTEEQETLLAGYSSTALASMVANAERGTIIVAALPYYYDDDLATTVYQGVFYEYTKECKLLRTVILDDSPGAYVDAGMPLPLHGEVVNDQLTFMGSSDGAMGQSTDSLDYAAVYRLDLGTGVFTTVISENETNDHSTDDPAFPGWTASLCLVPFGEHDIITAAGYSNGEGTAFGAYPDGTLEMWFQRWSYDGTWLGTLGFYYEPPFYEWGGPFYAIGGMSCDENGLLTFCYVGDLEEPLQHADRGGEYDGLVQMASSLIPSDGTVKYVSPSANLKMFWQTEGGLQEGIPFYLAKAIKPYNSSEIRDTRVRFQ